MKQRIAHDTCEKQSLKRDRRISRLVPPLIGWFRYNSSLVLSPCVIWVNSPWNYELLKSSFSPFFASSKKIDFIINKTWATAFLLQFATVGRVKYLTSCYDSRMSFVVHTCSWSYRQTWLHGTVFISLFLCWKHLTFLSHYHLNKVESWVITVITYGQRCSTPHLSTQ